MVLDNFYGPKELFAKEQGCRLICVVLEELYIYMAYKLGIGHTSS